MTIKWKSKRDHFRMIGMPEWWISQKREEHYEKLRKEKENDNLGGKKDD